MSVLREYFVVPEAGALLLLTAAVWLVLRWSARRRERRLASIVGARARTLARETAAGRRAFR